MATQFELTQMMADLFSKDELKDLCLALNLDFENFGGLYSKKRDVIYNIVAHYCKRPHIQPQFFDYLNAERPNVSWPDTIEGFSDDLAAVTLQTVPLNIIQIVVNPHTSTTPDNLVFQIWLVVENTGDRIIENIQISTISWWPRTDGTPLNSRLLAEIESQKSPHQLVRHTFNGFKNSRNKLGVFETLQTSDFGEYCLNPETPESNWKAGLFVEADGYAPKWFQLQCKTNAGVDFFAQNRSSIITFQPLSETKPVVA
jgi:hypothetical protein